MDDQALVHRFSKSNKNDSKKLNYTEKLYIILYMMKIVHITKNQISQL